MPMPCISYPTHLRSLLPARERTLPGRIEAVREPVLPREGYWPVMGKGSIWMAREGVGAVWGASCLFQVVNSGIQSAPTPPWPPVLSPSYLTQHAVAKQPVSGFLQENAGRDRCWASSRQSRGMRQVGEGRALPPANSRHGNPAGGRARPPPT